MKLPINIANKLLTIVEEGISVPFSSMQHVSVQKMIEDGVLQRIQTGRRKASLFIKDMPELKVYLHNHFGINDLADYVEKLLSQEFSRSEAVAISCNSKLSAERTFKGFLVNSFSPVPATLHGVSLMIDPAAGSFIHMYDHESFVPGGDVVIVGFENPENFRHVEKQQYLFKNIQPLFVCRYPYSRDLLKWLQKIPNRYLHFGDLDFAGINIYLNEYKKHLNGKASFFIPDEVEELLVKFGNKELYNAQLSYASTDSKMEIEIINLIQLFHKYKRVLEQEIFIKEIV